MTRLPLLSCLLYLAVALPAAAAPKEDPMQTDFARLTISPQAQATLQGADGKTWSQPGPCARAVKGGREFPAEAARVKGDTVTLDFPGAQAQATLRVTRRPGYLTVEVTECRGEVDELTFVDIPLTLKGRLEEPFAAGLLALNLQANVTRMPGPQDRLQASCYPRTGLAGARVALVACPPAQMRGILQQAVQEAPDLPKSPLGGPWALGQEITQGSYLFNFGGMTEQNVDQWIRLARDLGFTQIDFHGGSSFRFGDCRPNPETYPEGYASLKRVIDRLHAAGIKAGLHTYACFIAPDAPWITPVPDRRLGKDATFTLAAPLTAQADTVPVAETTERMSTVTGFFVRNSVVLQVEDELITYSGIAKEPPYAFTGCTRGAFGTKAAVHPAGARVHHLKQCFGLFAPDGDSTLLAEVAAKTAEIFNRCGFDMMYLDALDGEDVLGGREWSWHYGSKFVYEIWKRIDHPALMEMSTFHHHLWCVRSRAGAWDHPTRSHRRFIDLHVAQNADYARMFLPAQLGWWAVKTWSGHQGEPTFSEDLEYMGAKCLGTDTGFALMGVNPDNVDQTPALRRLATTIKRWEDLRHSGKVPEAVKVRLRQPGAAFTLDDTGRISPLAIARHKVEGMDGWSDRWQVANPYAAQPLALRIEALQSVGPYDDPGNPVLADFADPAALAGGQAQQGVTLTLTAPPAQAGARARVGLAAASTHTERKSSWAMLGRAFDPPLDLSQRPALGVWVHGDGRGEVLNLQTRSPEHRVAGIGEHYLVVDFTGWRYFTLVEPEGERYEDYAWPYGGAYAIYRESVNDDAVSALNLWVNNLPAGQPVSLALSAVKALPLVDTALHHPAITVDGQTITFPVDIKTGEYLELAADGECSRCGPDGKLLQQVKPVGSIPTLAKGKNDLRFAATTPDGAPARARVTVFSRGKPIWKP